MTIDVSNKAKMEAIIRGFITQEVMNQIAAQVASEVTRQIGLLKLGVAVSQQPAPAPVATAVPTAPAVAVTIAGTPVVTYQSAAQANAIPTAINQIEADLASVVSTLKASNVLT